VSELGVYTVPTGGGAGRRLLPYPRGAGEPQEITYSPDGRRLALTRWSGRTDGSNETKTLHLANPDGTGEREILPATFGPIHLAWSPSGDRLAFRDQGPEPGQMATYVVDVATEQVRRLAVHGYSGGFIQWSPDGRTLAWGGMSGDTGVWTVAADGSTSRRLDDVATRDVAWSPDGSELAVARMGGGVEVMDRDGGRRRVVDPDGIRVAWSPVDRDRLVTDTGGILRTANPDGGAPRFFAYGHLHGWLRSGSDVVATSVDGIHLIDLQGCGRTLVSGSGNEIAIRSWSPDGRTVLFIRHS
jgi:Tol biopolymer transport system component